MKNMGTTLGARFKICYKVQGLLALKVEWGNEDHFQGWLNAGVSGRGVFFKESLEMESFHTDGSGHMFPRK